MMPASKATKPSQPRKRAMIFTQTFDEINCPGIFDAAGVTVIEVWTAIEGYTSMSALVQKAAEDLETTHPGSLLVRARFEVGSSGGFGSCSGRPVLVVVGDLYLRR